MVEVGVYACASRASRLLLGRRRLADLCIFSHPRTDYEELKTKNVWLKGHTGQSFFVVAKIPAYRTRRAQTSAPSRFSGLSPSVASRFFRRWEQEEIRKNTVIKLSPRTLGEEAPVLIFYAEDELQKPS